MSPNLRFRVILRNNDVFTFHKKKCLMNNDSNSKQEHCPLHFDRLFMAGRKVINTSTPNFSSIHVSFAHHVWKKWCLCTTTCTTTWFISEKLMAWRSFPSTTFILNGWKIPQHACSRAKKSLSSSSASLISSIWTHMTDLCFGRGIKRAACIRQSLLQTFISFWDPGFHPSLSLILS